MLRVRRALDRDSPFQLRYIGQPELDRSRPTLVRSSIDVGCTSTILDFLTELGCRLDFEYVSRGKFVLPYKFQSVFKRLLVFYKKFF